MENRGCGGLGTALESVVSELEKMVKLDHKELEKSISRKSNDVTPERLLCYLLMCNRSPQTWQPKTIKIYCLTVSVGQESRRCLAGSSGSESLMRLQSAGVARLGPENLLPR